MTSSIFSQKDIRKSNFPETTSSEATDYFDLVRNGQNLKISQTNLINDFGSTGTLATRGEITGTPVLHQIATENYIRNIIDGAGITAGLSPQDGVELSHNFTVDKSGAEIMINETAISPTIRSLIGGTGINVAGAGDNIQIALSGSPASSKTVIVYSIDDFPPPIGGVITLLDDTEYLLENDVSSSNRFIFGENTVLSGADATLIELEYTGAGIMLTANDKNVKIRDIRLRCDSGTLFSISSAGGTHNFRYYTGNVSCNNVGTFHNLLAFYFDNVNFNNITTNGFNFTGHFSVVLFDTLSARMPSGAGNLLTLGTATFDYITIDKGLWNISTTGYVISGLANSGNISATGLGVVLNSRQFGTTDPQTDNIFPSDDRWEFILNPKIQNSFDNLLATHGGATLTITTIATPVIIGPTWTEQSSSRFTSTAGGRFTYTGYKGTNVDVTATITADLVTGIDSCSFFVYKNSSQITASRITREFNAGDEGNVSLVWNMDLVNNDYIELWAQNDDATADIIIVKVILRITG